MTAARDSYFFTYIDSGWLATNFENDFSRFPYIGAREKLAQMQKEKGVVRRVVESLVKRIKIKSVLGYITEKIIGWKPTSGDEPNKLAEDLIKIFEEESNKRTIARFLTDTQDRCRKHHRYFYTVSVWSSTKSSLFQAKLSSLQDEMIVVSGQLVHRDAIAQCNPLLAQTVAPLPGEWLLTDFPPHGMVKENDRFDGKILCLVAEPKFSQVFQQYLPFRKDIGWYPYCRVTGFFKEPGYGQSAPSLDLVMAEFRRPKPYQEKGKKFFAFFDGEFHNLIKKRIYLKQPSELLSAGYVLPLLAKGSSIEDYKATDDEKTVLQEYLALVGANLPAALKIWYENA